MVTTLDLLIVEDSDDDVTLVLRELERSGFRPRSQRCEDPDGFRAALHHAFDIILCDYSLSAFSFVEALEILKSSGRGIPMVLVSGTIGEEGPSRRCVSARPITC